MFLISFFSCDDGEKAINDSHPPEYIKVEIYCYCLVDYSSTDRTFFGSCCTPALIHSYEIIEPNKLFYITDNPETIERLRVIFFDKTNQIDTLTEASNARFVVLFNTNEMTSDTLIFENNNSFNFNEKFRFNYSFSIMDSIKPIINKMI